MTLEDIEQQFPQGFRDAILENLEFNAVIGVLTLKFNIWLEHDRVSNTETWRKGKVVFREVSFFTISPHCLVSADGYNSTLKRQIVVYDLVKGLPEDLTRDKSLPNKNQLASCFFMGDGQMFFRLPISYMDAEFKWAGEAIKEHPPVG